VVALQHVRLWSLKELLGATADIYILIGKSWTKKLKICFFGISF
jgi:hypothetical protein